MKKDDMIEIIVDFILDKRNDKIAVVANTDGMEFFQKDYKTKNKIGTTPAVVSTQNAQRELYKDIANALIDNSPSDPFSGLGGSQSRAKLEARLKKGLIFGGGGVGFDTLYPSGDEYEYRLMAWVK